MVKSEGEIDLIKLDEQMQEDQSTSEDIVEHSLLPSKRLNLTLSVHPQNSMTVLQSFKHY